MVSVIIIPFPEEDTEARWGDISEQPRSDDPARQFLLLTMIKKNRNQ